jgi:hypothetical protein
MPARNNRECVTIHDAYSSCYVAPAAYACTVMSHNNRRDDANGVLCGSTPWLYDSTDSVERVSAVQLRIQLWSVNQRATDAEESPLLRFVNQETSSEDMAEE